MSEEIVPTEGKLLECSFCNKRQDQVKKLIAGSDVYICNECIELCFKLLKNDESEEFFRDESLTPKKIKEFLDQYIIGQEYTKTVISVAVHNHFKRINDRNEDDVELDKSNILLVGPTGSGKTLIAKTIAKFLNIPFAMADATTLTSFGYVGEDPDSVIIQLLNAANNDVKKAERGIVYIDEIDKKSKRSENVSITRDVSGEDVQQALLKLIEGSVCQVPPQGGRKHPNQEMVTINTKNILFIVGGAFIGLDKIVESRLNNSGSIGFGAQLKDDKSQPELFDTLKRIEPEDLVKFGLIPELVGRLPVYGPLEELSEDQLVQVLTEPKNSIVKQFKKLFNLENVELEFMDDALRDIAKIAIERKTGARGLRAVIEQKLMQTQFNLPDLYQEGVRKIIVDKESVTSDSPPKQIFKKVA